MNTLFDPDPYGGEPRNRKRPSPYKRTENVVPRREPWFLLANQRVQIGHHYVKEVNRYQTAITVCGIEARKVGDGITEQMVECPKCLDALAKGAVT